MNFIYCIVIIYLIYVPRYVEPESSHLIPVCPNLESGYRRSCEPTCEDIYGNYLCSDEQLCCEANCGEFCAAPENHTSCPDYEYDSSVTCPDPPETCYDLETGDDLCALEGKICCLHQCGDYCADPVYYAVCPNPEPEEYDSFQCRHPTCDDYGKDICGDGKICCRQQCGERCVEPDYYQVSCPNMSVLDEPEEWKKWTSFCIKDCDCHKFEQICCESPCGCELDICRYPIIKQALCPVDCFFEDMSSCGRTCLEFDKLCCNCNGDSRCHDPDFVYVPLLLGDIDNPVIP